MSNNKLCPRCNGSGVNGEDSVLGYPEGPCYYCHGTGKWLPLTDAKASAPPMPTNQPDHQEAGEPDGLKKLHGMGGQ